jgi:hypothetical protein
VNLGDTDTLLVVVAALAFGVSLFAGWVSQRGLRVSREAKQIAERGLQTTANQYASELMLKADDLFVQWPMLRPYFFDDVPTDGMDDEALRHRVEAAGEYLLDVMEAIWDHSAEFVDEDAESWREWMHGFLQTSPTMQGTYDAEWYPSLRKMLAAARCTKPEEHEWAYAQALEYTSEPAVQLAYSALRQAQSVGKHARSAKLLKLVASAEIRGKRLDRAVRLAAASKHHTRTRRAEEPDAVYVNDPLERARELMNRGDYAAGSNAGKEMTLDEAVAYALKTEKPETT